MIWNIVIVNVRTNLVGTGLVACDLMSEAGAQTVLYRLKIIANFIVVNFISFTEILFVQILGF